MWIDILVLLVILGRFLGLQRKTTVVARSQYLRGFDQQMAQLVVSNMQSEGTAFINDMVPIELAQKHGSDRLLVKLGASNEQGQTTGRFLHR